MSQNNQQTKNISWRLGSFVNYDSSTGNRVYSVVDVSFYNESLAFNFSKGVKGDVSTRKTAFIAFPYESAVLISQTVDKVLAIRDKAFNEDRLMDLSAENYIYYESKFIDKTTSEVRTGNIFSICSVVEDGVSRLAIVLNTGSEEYRVVLRNDRSFSMIPKNDNRNNDLRINESDLKAFSFGLLLHKIISNWPIHMQIDKLGSIIMKNHVMYCDKMGIKFNNQQRIDYNDGSKYESENYRTSQSNQESFQNSGDIPF